MRRLVPSSHRGPVANRYTWHTEVRASSRRAPVATPRLDQDRSRDPSANARPFAHFFSPRREEVVPQAVRPLALDRGRSTPLDSVSSPWPPVAERPTVVGHGRGAGVPPRRMLPGRARTYRLPGHRCQGCGPPFATNARAAGPVRRPEFWSPSPWCVAVPAPQVGLTCSSVGVSLADQTEDRTFSPNFAPALPG
jgi:hypothetical protein